MLATLAEAEDTASSFKNDGAAVQIVDCEKLSTFAQAKRVNGYLSYSVKPTPKQMSFSM
jgi:hypothetical protein